MTKRNENRPGYKKTQAGWIPEAWECVSLDSLTTVKTGPFGAQLHEQDYVEKGTPIITVEHLSEQGIVHRNLPMVSDADKKRLSQYTLKTRDIVFSRVGSVDRNSLVSNRENGWLFSGRLLRVRVRNRNSLSQFLSRYLHLETTKQYLRRIAVGGTMACLNTQLLSGVPIPLPPLPEQERIAEVLGAWDRAIGLTDRLIEAKQRLKKGLMQQLLTGRLRFPQFGKPTRKHGELPKGWSEIRLGKCLSQIIGGGTPSKAHPEYWNGNIPWATVKDASRGNTYDTLDHISNVGIRESSASLIPAGTILICTRMAVGKTIRFNCAVAINQDLKALFPKDSLRSDYLLVLLKFHEPQISHLGSGSTVSGIRLEELRNLPILLPDLLEQRHIASCLSACEREIQLLNGRRDRLQEQKKGLMQKLLTGEVRIMERRRG